MSQFYEIDSRAVTHREYWWGTASPLVLIGWIIKWLRVRIPSSSDDPNTDSTLPFVVDQLPPEIQSGFSVLAADLNSLGFTDPIYHIIHDPGTRTTVYWATYRHESGQFIARLHQRFWEKAAKSNRGLFPMFFTEFADGTFLVSSAGKPDMASPATVRMNRQPKAPVAVLWARHQKLASEAAAQQQIILVASGAEVVAATERHHVLVRDFHLQRGVFRPRTEAENQEAERFARGVAAAKASGCEYPEVLAEVTKLQEQRTDWKPALWILLGSAVLFLAAGATQWDPTFALWLIPVLLIHESGHWLAMKIFKYRNLRMFFIPLFGAAVTGQNYNVAGWKKALVSLAGPLPGIALGAVLGVVGLVTHQDWMNHAALIFLLINGFNLLPVLPLDGGHVLHATLFCRNRWLDVTFRVLAILGLLGLSAIGMGRAMLYLAIFMGVSLPLTFAVGKATDQLRLNPPPPPLPGQDGLGAATAQAIIGALKATLPKSTNTKMLATQTLQVYETLNARPPGVPATLGLLALHAGGVMMTLIFGILLVIGRHGGFGDFFSAAARQPTYPIQCGEIRTKSTTAASNAGGPRTMLTTTCLRRSDAAMGFDQLAMELPEGGQLTLIGNSLLLEIAAGDDAGREQWFDRLQSVSTNTFVSVSNRAAMVEFTCIAPTAIAATNLVRELESYFASAMGKDLIPPWSPRAQAPEFKQFAESRRSWHLITTELNRIWQAPQLKELNQKVAAARKRGANKEVEQLSATQQAAIKRIREATLESLRTNPTNRVDPTLLDFRRELDELSYTNRPARQAVMRRITERLGPEAEARNAGAPGRYGANSGFVSQHGLVVELRYACFVDAPTGFPALLEWLCGKGCLGAHYDLGPGYEGSSDLEEPIDE